MNNGIRYVEVDTCLRARIEREWNKMLADHVVLENGFSVAALHGEEIVGLIGVQWMRLPQPLTDTTDAYINVIEVRKEFRQQGIARRLLKITEERAREQSVYQIRAWSSEDKLEAIPMWKALGYGLCPAITYPRGLTIHGYFAAKVLDRNL